MKAIRTYFLTDLLWIVIYVIGASISKLFYNFLTLNNPTLTHVGFGGYFPPNPIFMQHQQLYLILSTIANTLLSFYPLIWFVLFIAFAFKHFKSLNKAVIAAFRCCMFLYLVAAIMWIYVNLVGNHNYAVQLLDTGMVLGLSIVAILFYKLFADYVSADSKKKVSSKKPILIILCVVGSLFMIYFASITIMGYVWPPIISTLYMNK